MPTVTMKDDPRNPALSFGERGDAAGGPLPGDGTTFAGRYRVVRRIAAGGMGAVYEAVHVVTERRCALKVMLPVLAASEPMQERFRFEARAAARLQCDHIVQVLDAGVDAVTGTPYLVMELLAGETLADRVKRAGRLAPSEVVQHLGQAAIALDALHAAGIVHRDFKPANLCLSPRGALPQRVKVIDFGIAKLLSRDPDAVSSTREWLGTPAYIAPEQLDARAEITAAADIYAFGMTAFTLLAGAPYWQEELRRVDSLLAFAITASRGPEEAATARARRLGAALPPAFDAWFARAAARSPAHRFPTATAAAAALAAALGEPPLSFYPGDPPVATAPDAAGSGAPGPPPAPRPPPGRLRATAVACTFLAGLALAALARPAGWTRHRAPSDARRAATGGSSPRGPDLDLRGAAPPVAPALFAAPPGAGPGPCILDPEPDALIPRNWRALRISFLPAAGQNLFEIRVRAGAGGDIVAYTTDTTWTVPAPSWRALAARAAQQPITISVRGARHEAGHLASPPAAGAPVTVRVAPADAEGTILYSAGNKDSMILGLTVESSAPAPVLRPEQVALGTITSDGRREAPVTCIGCHEASPDGRFLGFTAQAPWGNAIAALAAEGARAGEVPAFLGAGARRALAQQDMGIQSFSAARWGDREHVVATALGVSTSSQLAWLDLDAPLHDGRTPLRIVRRRGDPRGAGAPALSADGETIAYVSTNVEYTGRLGDGEADLYAVPSRGGAGGEARPIAGASEPDHAEYYPAFSPDDRYLIYTRAPNGNMYQRPAAEIYAIPSTGGTPVRLAANDPPACSGRPSPGVTNSWARWSPMVGRVGQSTYYWLVFSSRRRGDTPQIYVAGVVEEGGRLSTFGALHVPIQNPDGNNHTPTWSRYRLPE